MEKKYVQYKNKSIHYKVYGNGKPVVFLHGIPVNCNVWNEIAKSLQKEFLIITPDLPGSGRSEMLEGENVSIENYADAVKAILDEELGKAQKIKKIFSSQQCSPYPPPSRKIGGVTMIGHSMGGYIALAFAEKYPQLLNGFGLFHSTAFADDEEKKQTRRKAIEFIKTKGAYAFLRTSTPNLFSGKQHLKEMNDIIEGGKKFNAEALIQYYQAMINRPDRTHVLKQFEKPVLFIIGGKDTVVPLQASLQQCHLNPISHVHVLETGHMGMVEESSKSKLFIKSFLQKI